MNLGLLNKIKKKYIVPYTNNSQNIYFFGIFFLIISIVICQIYSAGIMSLFYYIFSVTLFTIFCIRSIKAKKLLMHIGYYILIICTEISFFITIASNLFLTSNPTVLIHGYIVAIVNFFLILLQCIQLLYHCITHRREQHILNKEFICVFIIACMVSILFSVECMNTWCRWDSYNYYNAVYNLSIDNFFQNGINGLAVCGHISTAFALYSMVIHRMTGLDLLNAMYFGNIILMIIDIILFYYIFKKLIPAKKFLFYILCALLCGFSPYVLGMIYDISPELLLLTGILLFICGNLYEQFTLCLIAVFVMCNTKEVGVVISALMVATSLVKSVFCYYREKKLINVGYYLCSMVLGILWLIHYRQVNWAAIMREKKDILLLLDGTPISDFHFSPLYIMDVLKGEFLTNFSWLFLLVFCLAVIKILVLLFHYHGVFWKKIICGLWNYWEIVAGFVGYQIVTCLFVTYHLYRYYIPFIAFIYIIGVGLINYLIGEKRHQEKICNIVLCIIAILFFIQSHYTIDFVMLKEFGVFDTGNGKVAALDMHMIDYYDPGFTDAALYNRQIMYFDKAFDKSLSLLNPDNDTAVLISNEFVAKKDLGSGYTIRGFGYKNRNPVRWIKFDTDKKRRYLEETPENELKLNFISEKTDVKTYYLEKNERVFYIEMPWEKLASHYLKEEYKDSFVLYGTVKYRGWVLNVYQFIG